MKNILLTALLCAVSSLSYSQNSIESSTSIGSSFRAYAPVVGTTINENPVFEFIQSFSKNKISILFIKSIDLVDQQSSGNYSLLLGKYQIYKKKNISLWATTTVIQSDFDFIPSGEPLFIFQTGISKQYSSRIFGTKLALVRQFDRLSKNNFILNPYIQFKLKNKSFINTDVWLSDNDWIIGIAYKNTIFNNDNGIMRFNIRYNYRQGWVNQTHNGLINFGISYTIK